MSDKPFNPLELGAALLGLFSLGCAAVAAWFSPMHSLAFSAVSFVCHFALWANDWSTREGK